MPRVIGRRRLGHKRDNAGRFEDGGSDVLQRIDSLLMGGGRKLDPADQLLLKMVALNHALADQEIALARHQAIEARM